ncbi:YD repeat-containing protein [Treponema pedis str. T A4]|uniref:YD repeat-containing protein n=1 Tax=Treponema pedis str. T A4 TaxID=1291379 RepID=S6A091_9SPIR|nr:YD repeat-containing protein [Treponema pedis str. T A4]
MCISKKQALTGGKSLACEDKCSKKIGAVSVQQADRRSFEASAVPILVYFYIIMINKYRQSAKRRLLLNKSILSEVFSLTIGSEKTMTFENRHVGCKEREKINRRRTLCTLRINFFEATSQTACIFSKEMTHTDNHRDNDEQKEKRYYYHSDHLGSAQFVTDWKGRQYEHIEYTPYGELWVEETALGIDKLPFRFTGKELDEETGLYYYGARYLDPKYSRWLSGDPALGEYIPKAPIDDEAKKHNENLPNGGVYNAINLHVFNYGNNNHIKYNDPTGEIPFMVVTGVIGAFIAGGYSIASDLTNGRNVNWKKAGAYAAAGGLAGLTLGGVAAMVTTTTPLVAGSATASFSSVTGLGVSTTGSAALGLPLASQIYEKFSHALTSAQLSSVKKVAEISHALKTHKNLTGELLDPGHITKLKNSMVGLQKSLISIQNSLKNPNLTQEARNVLKMAENEATSIINRIGELIN